MIYLDVEDLLYIAERATCESARVRDIGLLQSAAARPASSAFGSDAYQSLHEKAASLLHSILRNHALVDGNKRLGLAAVIAFYGVNGRRLTMTNDEAYEFVMMVAAGDLDEVGAIARRLEMGSEDQ